jgi:hypothetical protein
LTVPKSSRATEGINKVVRFFASPAAVEICGFRDLSPKPGKASPRRRTAPAAIPTARINRSKKLGGGQELCRPLPGSRVKANTGGSSKLQNPSVRPRPKWERPECLFSIKPSSCSVCQN